MIIEEQARVYESGLALSLHSTGTPRASASAGSIRPSMSTASAGKGRQSAANSSQARIGNLSLSEARMVHAPPAEDDCRKSRDGASAVTADVRMLAQCARGASRRWRCPERPAESVADRPQRLRLPDFGCSMVPVQRFEPQRQPHNALSFAVCGSSSTMP